MTLTVRGQVLHFHFRSRAEMGRTFLRFQETYESPKFAGQVFTRAQFRNWYADRYGSYTYPTDWDGFNVPDYVFRRFIDGDFDPLSSEEKRLLRAIKGTGLIRYYVIATCDDSHRGTYLHEMAHACYYLFPTYRLKAWSVLARLGIPALLATFEFLYGSKYNTAVLLDEAQAYMVDGYFAVSSVERYKQVWARDTLRPVLDSYIRRLR